MEVTHSAPTADSYTPFSVHQSQTPESFFSGPPVLYHHSPSTTLLINSHELQTAPAIAEFTDTAPSSTNGTATYTNGDTETEDAGQELSIPDVGVWVTSERLVLYSSSKNVCVSISYPSISLHAIQGPTSSHPASLFIQILTQEQYFDDHDPDSTISLTIIPALSPQNAPTTPSATVQDAENGHALDTQVQDSAQSLYTALSACANLHPDPLSEDDEEGVDGNHPNVMFEGDVEGGGMYLLSTGGGEGLPPPLPGSGGWITAENVNEYFDEEGNFTRGSGLGGGAGNVRMREDGDAEGSGDGVEDETKWRRTE